MTLPLPLEWLCCPVSGQALQPAGAELLERLEAARKAGTLAFAREPEVKQINLTLPFTDGLVSEDGARFYVIEAGLPILLPDHAIAAR